MSVLKSLFELGQSGYKAVVKPTSVLLRDLTERRKAQRANSKELERWSELLETFGPTDAPSVRNAHVQLDVSFHGVDQQSKTTRQTAPTSHLAAINANALLIGPAGAGKTSSLKYIAQSLYSKYQQGGPRPLLVRCRELTDERSFAHTLREAIGSQFGSSADNTRLKVSPVAAELAAELNAQRAIVIVDGLDEASLYSISRIEDELIKLSEHLDQARILASTRPGRVTFFPNFKVFEIQPLNQRQQHEFVSRILAADEVQPFWQAFEHAGLDGTQTFPMALAQYCAIFATTGTLPTSARQRQGDIVRLLIRDWDSGRKVDRLSKFPQLTIERKQWLLEDLAFELSIDTDESHFESARLLRAFSRIHTQYGLPSDAGPDLASEIQEHTGLIRTSGPASFEFLHKTYQEYLAACAVVRYGEISSSRVIRSPDVAAIALSLHPDPVKFIAQALGNIGSLKLPETRRWVQSLVARVQLEQPQNLVDDVWLWTLLWSMQLPLARHVAGEWYDLPNSDGWRLLQDHSYCLEALPACLKRAMVVSKSNAFLQLSPTLNVEIPRNLADVIGNSYGVRIPVQALREIAQASSSGALHRVIDQLINGMEE